MTVENVHTQQYKRTTGKVMLKITKEQYETFDTRFPESMSLEEIAAELDRMRPQEAEAYNCIFCDGLFVGFCSNYLKFDKAVKGTIVSSDEYRIFRKCAAKQPAHFFYDAWTAFLEDRYRDVRPNIHEYIQTFKNETPPFGEADIAGGLLLGFKNAYKGFWLNSKKEIESIPHDEIAVRLCDVIDAFYNASTNEDALEVLISAYQQYPDSPTINEMLGVVYYDEKQYGNAIAAFERLYDEENDTYKAILHTQDQICFYLGYANDKLKDRKAAISYYEKAVEIYPMCPYAANNLGYAYYREKQYDKAYIILKRCIDEKLEADIVYPVTNFARLLYAMGRYHEAKEFIKAAPARVPKSIREKIEKAPDRDVEKVRAISSADENENNAEPEMKPAIERKGVQFQSEKVLEDELTMRLEAGMEVFGIPLKIYRRRGEYGRQYIFPEGRLDILAEDPDGNLYIIELKKDSGYDDAYKQIAQYIDWFQKHKANGKKVYGIICLNAPDKALIEAVRQDDRMKLFEYQISYSEIR